MTHDQSIGPAHRPWLTRLGRAALGKPRIELDAPESLPLGGISDSERADVLAKTRARIERRTTALAG